MNIQLLNEILNFTKQSIENNFARLFESNRYRSHPDYNWIVAHTLMAMYDKNDNFHIKTLNTLINILGDNKYPYSIEKKEKWLRNHSNIWAIKNDIALVSVKNPEYNPQIIMHTTPGNVAVEKELQFCKLTQVVRYEKRKRKSIASILSGNKKPNIEDSLSETKVGFITIHTKNKTKTELCWKTEIFKNMWRITSPQILIYEYIRYGNRISTLFEFLKKNFKNEMLHVYMEHNWGKNSYYQVNDAVIDYFNIKNEPLTEIQKELLNTLNLDFKSAIHMINQSKIKIDNPIELPIFDFTL